MSLKKYKQKRNFKLTPEPAGKKGKNRKKLLYLIQKHAASHLHYDLRLELNGVLKSWAVPKGPSLDPTVKRLAVHVEDHPISYGSFEGIIPAGQYGGGTVMLWDTGEWECQDTNPNTAYKNGDLKFIVKGKKLKGLWKLIRLKNDPKNWLLIKGKDRYARSENTYAIVEKKPNSVISRRSLAGIAAKADKKSIPSFAMDYPFTHPNKILYPNKKITKLDLANYYQQIHSWILPYVIKRPLSLVRCPQGQQQKCFYQKHINDMAAKNIYTLNIKEKNSGIESYIYIKDTNGLMEFIQLNVLEIHPWGCRIDKLEKPDMIIFDLDPGPGVAWKTMIETAYLVKENLKKINLIGFVKTTGGKGLHVVVPIKPLYSWNEIKTFSHAFVEYLVSLHPHLYLANMNKSKRKNKIFIDYLRNQRGATTIAPYSTRASKNASVSTPLTWDELSNRIKSDTFTVKNLPDRLKTLKKDPWGEFFELKQKLKLPK
ncbi:MAG TPA: non-homologous end-joining DNA ligase [Gammaproteobacteria bacterium]|jgi:bifunctional non-homologous end joining protein LigD|nr:non-homologous end-joining DNA ligase [Gammaproteobacteria bacterium]